MADERIKLILDLGNSGKNAAEVRQELDKLDAAAKHVGETYEVLAASGHGYELGAERVTIEQKRATQAMEAAAAEANRLAIAEQTLANGAMDKVTRAAIEATQAQRAMNAVLAEGATRISTTHVGMAQLGGATRNISQLALDASYTFQDFTSQLGTRGLAGALGAAQNNIPGLLRDLGQGAGLAGVISVAAVAVGLLYENWGKLREAFGSDDIAKRIQDMKDLADATKAANDANVKLATSVKGDDETQRAAAFRKALQAYGGGEKLLNEEGGQDPGNRAFVADAIAKALKGSETDIGFLKGGSQSLATAMAQPAIEADEKENERRVAARQKRREDAAREAERADKEAEAANQKALRAAAKGLADVLAAGRGLVPEPMLKKQPLMDLTPDGGGWDGLDGGGLMDDPGHYRPRTHDERIEANRRRKAGNRGGGGLRNVGVGPPDDAAEARQALGGAMQDLQAVAAGAGAWKPALMQLSAAVRQLAAQVNGQGFSAYQPNRPVNMDVGW